MFIYIYIYIYVWSSGLGAGARPPRNAQKRPQAPQFNDLGVVFTGDFVFAEGIGRTDLFSGSSEEMKESINSVFLQLDPDYDIFPGHGKSDSFKNILKYNSYLWEFIND